MLEVPTEEIIWHVEGLLTVVETECSGVPGYLRAVQDACRTIQMVTPELGFTFINLNFEAVVIWMRQAALQ